jgi:hypothetical protein
MVGPADVLVAQEQHLVLKQRILDRTEQIVAASGFPQVHSVNLGPDMAGEFLYAHHSTSIRIRL